MNEPLEVPAVIVPAGAPDAGVIQAVNRDVCTIHYLHEADDGQVFSGSAGVSDRTGIPGGIIQALQPGALQKKRYRFACHPTAVFSHFHRGSNELSRGAGDAFVITCKACLESERFLKDLRAHESQFDPTIMLDASGKCC